MWKHVLPPVILVIVFWLIISLSTTAYITHVDVVHQRILSQNVTSMDVAGDLQVACWRLLAEDLKDSLSSREAILAMMPRLSELNDSIVMLESSAATTREMQILDTIKPNFTLLSETVASCERQGDVKSDSMSIIRSVGERISEAAFQIRKYNGKLIEAEEASQQRLRSKIFLFRNTALILGPLIGIVVGWRIITSLQRRISTLAITLRSVASNTVYTVGEYSLDGANDLRDIQRLSEKVVQQMQKVGRDLERAELEIIQAERLAAVGELAAGVAHELRNPLTSIKLFLQHAATTDDCGVVKLCNLELILSEIRRMERTIQGLLDFSRPTDLNCRIHDIRVPLQRAVTLVSGRAIASKVTIKSKIASSPMLVDGDIEQFHLVFVNLLINAVESMEEGGLVEVEASGLDAESKIRITVRDHGTGLTDDMLKRLFEPFATTKEHGTGLGLAICHRIISSHEGSITAINMPDGGAAFQIILDSVPSVVPSEIMA